MTPTELHARAQQTFADVLAQVTDDHLDLPTPCTDWTVRDLLDHVNGGNRWATELLGADVPPMPDGDRGTVHAATAATVQAAFEQPDALTNLVELPFGQLPGAVYASIRSGDLYTHAWDLATAIGADTDLDQEVGEAILAATVPFLSPALRGEGRPFGLEQPCDEDRPVADRLAAVLGRRVD